MPDAQVKALEELQSMPWREISLEEIDELWPLPTDKGFWFSRSGEGRCEGSWSVSDLELVEMNECKCCATFLFDEIGDAPACRSQLSGMTIERATSTREEAAKQARKWFRSWSRGLERDFALQGRPIETATVTIAVGVQRGVDVSMSQISSGWLVVLRAYEISVPVEIPRAPSQEP